METIEEKVFEQFCFDFYGELLSDRQKTILDYYYNDDFSLSEIAGIIGVTRQGVHDAWRRAKNRMLAYEEKLGLVSRHLKNRSILTEINAEVSSLLSDASVSENDALRKKIAELEDSINAIIEGF